MDDAVWVLHTMSGFFGFQNPGGSSGDYNAQAFVIQQHMRRMNTSTLVKVVNVTNAGELSPVGFVDIQPMVDLVDGDNNRIPHGVIYKCPYFRLQGGANAIILDPQAGDIGIALFADRDISSVIANKGQAAPGSARRFDMADGLYIGGCLNGTPTQYVRFSSAGIELNSPTQIKLVSPDVRIEATTVEIVASSSVTVTTPTWTLNGNQVNNGNVTSTGTVMAPTLNATTQLLAQTKDVGPNHQHDHGTMTATGHTGTVL